MFSKHERFHLIRPLCASGSPVTQLNKSFIKNYTKDIWISNQPWYSYLINKEFLITIKLYYKMPQVGNIKLNMWTFNIFQPRAFKRSHAPLHTLKFNNVLWKSLFSDGNIWKSAEQNSFLSGLESLSKCLRHQWPVVVKGLKYAKLWQQQQMMKTENRMKEHFLWF